MCLFAKVRFLRLVSERMLPEKGGGCHLFQVFKVFNLI